MSITYKKNAEEKFEVKFPFMLKDSFKQTFKTAKWDSINRAWVVGPRSEKRLKQWIELVSDVAQVAAETDEFELRKDEIELLKASLMSTLDAIENIINARNIYEATESALLKIKEELATAKAKRDKERAEKDAAFERARELLASVVDLDAIYRAKNEMQMLHRRVGGDSTYDFNKAQSVISAEHAKLKELGFVSFGLSILAGMSKHRPDRDNVLSVGDAEIFCIRKIEQGE